MNDEESSMILSSDPKKYQLMRATHYVSCITRFMSTVIAKILANKPYSFDLVPRVLPFRSWSTEPYACGPKPLISTCSSVS